MEAITAVTPYDGVYNWGRGKHRILAQDDRRDFKSPRKVPLPDTEDFVSLSAGSQHTVALTKNGQLYTWGFNKYGQLGQPLQSPAIVLNITFKYVSAGSNHTLAITTDGKVFAWGLNSDGQLGTGDTNNRTAPTQVKTKRKFASVAGGATHSLGVTDEAKIYSWGSGKEGKLGHGDEVDHPVPKEVFVHSKLRFASASAGEEHSAAITIDGKLFTWGKSYLSRLGHGVSDQNVLFPREVKKFSPPVQLNSSSASLNIHPEVPKFIQVVAAFAHTVALSDAGDVYCTGWNLHGQLGDLSKDDSAYFKPIRLNIIVPSTPSSSSTTISSTPIKISQIAAGHGHTMILTSTGQLLGFGSGFAGQVGSGIAEVTNLAPTETRRPTGIKRWSFVAAGGDHTVAIGKSTYITSSPTLSVRSPRKQVQEGAALTERKKSAKDLGSPKGSPRMIVTQTDSTDDSGSEPSAPPSPSKGFLIARLKFGRDKSVSPVAKKARPKLDRAQSQAVVTSRKKDSPTKSPTNSRPTSATPEITPELLYSTIKDMQRDMGVLLKEVSFLREEVARLTVQQPKTLKSSQDS